jgi:hypothetical protein
MLCVPLIEASWFQRTHIRRMYFFKRPRDANSNPSRDTLFNPQNATSSSVTGNFSIDATPTAQVILPSVVSQGMVVTSIVPVYQVCDPSTAGSPSCSTVLSTITTSSCSTVIPGLATSVTVTDCDQFITFSSSNDVSIATATSAPSASASGAAGIQKRATHRPQTWVEKVECFYIAPWKAVAGGAPTDVTVLCCKTNMSTNSKDCNTIKEVWVVHNVEAAVVKTSTVSISSVFASVSIFSHILSENRYSLIEIASYYRHGTQKQLPRPSRNVPALDHNPMDRHDLYNFKVCFNAC